MVVYFDMQPLYGYTVHCSHEGLELLSDYHASKVEEWKGLIRYTSGFSCARYDKEGVEENDLIVKFKYSVVDIREHIIVVQFVKI